MQERKIITAGDPGGGWSSPAVVGGGLVFVSAVNGTAANAGAEADVAAQTTVALARLGRVLEAAGSSLAQAVSVHVYLRRASDFDAMNQAYRAVFAENPPVRTTVVAGLPAGVLVMVSAIGVPLGAPRELLHPSGWMKSPRPYSYIVKAGDLVFLSGLVSRRGSDDQVVPGSVSLQTKTILDNAGTLLKTAGLSYEDVVAARVFLTDDSFFEAMNDEYRRYFPSEPPARATAVADLMGPDASVEISLIASQADKQVLGPSVAPSLPLSSAVRTGDLLFLSGVLGNTDANAGNLGAQTREVLTRIGRTLDGLGLSYSHVVDNMIYVTDVWQERQVDEVYREFVPDNPPARTFVGARLVTRAGLVEMMMTAVGR
jgi:2-iminobutanoate/2-iminopropanoate deaminase